MKDMSPELRRLVDDARAADDPTAADRDRVRAALVAVLAAGGGAAATATGGGKLGLMGRLGLVTLIGALLAGGVWWFVSSSSGGEDRVAAVPTSDPAPVSDPVPDPVPDPVLDPVPDPAPVSDPDPGAQPPDAAPHVTSTPARRAKPKPRDAAQLAEEARLLREAETARRGGDIALASERLAEHRRRFPRGALTTEREAARILVLCDAGRAGEAKKLAARFLRRYPRSPLADRVRSACERSIP